MGVKGLLPCLQSITRPTSLEKYRGLTVAVDAMCWLHKGIFAAGDLSSLAKFQYSTTATTSDENREDNGNNDDDRAPEDTSNPMNGIRRRLHFSTPAPTKIRPPPSNTTKPSANASLAVERCVRYVIRRTKSLASTYGIPRVLLVIDGAPLPAKSDTNAKRRADRIASYRKALDAEEKGDAPNARKFFGRCISITHDVRRELVEACRREGVEFVVAPYEADAQLARLACTGMVDAVVSEDSDLLAYGCPRVLFKLDEGGRGEEVQILRDLAENAQPCFGGWSPDMFVYLCLLVGCDYCEGVKGLGIIKAHKFVRVYRSPARIFKALRAVGKFPHGFEEEFMNGYRTFRHQRVYCSEKGEIEPLFPITEEGDQKIWDFLGPWLEPNIGQGIANGTIHPMKKIPWNTVIAAQLCGSREGLHHTDSVYDTPRDSMTSEVQKSSVVVPVCRTKKIAGDENLFAFARQTTKRKSDHDDPTQDHLPRPPLQEIEVDSQGGNTEHSERLRRCQQQPIPHTFDDYSSMLVGQSFRTLSRGTAFRLAGRGKGGEGRMVRKQRGEVSKAIQNLQKKIAQHREGRRQKQQAVPDADPDASDAVTGSVETSRVSTGRSEGDGDGNGDGDGKKLRSSSSEDTNAQKLQKGGIKHREIDSHQTHPAVRDVNPFAINLRHKRSDLLQEENYERMSCDKSSEYSQRSNIFEPKYDGKNSMDVEVDLQEMDWEKVKLNADTSSYHSRKSSHIFEPRHENPGFDEDPSNIYDHMSIDTAYNGTEFYGNKTESAVSRLVTPIEVYQGAYDPSFDDNLQEDYRGGKSQRGKGILNFDNYSQKTPFTLDIRNECNDARTSVSHLITPVEAHQGADVPSFDDYPKEDCRDGTTGRADHRTQQGTCIPSFDDYPQKTPLPPDTRNEYYDSGTKSTTHRRTHAPYYNNKSLETPLVSNFRNMDSRDMKTTNFDDDSCSSRATTHLTRDKRSSDRQTK